MYSYLKIFTVKIFYKDKLYILFFFLPMIVTILLQMNSYTDHLLRRRSAAACSSGCAWIWSIWDETAEIHR